MLNDIPRQMTMGLRQVENQHFGVRADAGNGDRWFAGEGGGVAGNESVIVDGGGAADYVYPGVASGFQGVLQSPASLYLTDQNFGVLMNFQGTAALGRRHEDQFAELLFFGEAQLLVGGLQAVGRGLSQIWRKCTGSVFDPLNSLCTMPVPALMRCRSLAYRVSTLPMLSLCARAPLRT